MIGASNINPLSSAAGIGTVGAATLAAGAATGGAALAAAGTATIVGTIAAITTDPICVGSTGGGIFSDGPVIQCVTVCRNTNVDPASVAGVIGTPTMATKTLAGLTGYVETKNFSVSGSMTDIERNMINRLMDGGVYIE